MSDYATQLAALDALLYLMRENDPEQFDHNMQVFNTIMETVNLDENAKQENSQVQP